MEQRYQKNGLVNWITLLVATLVSVLVARYAGVSTGSVGSIYLALGFLVAVVSFIQMGLAQREHLERLEFEELKKAKGDSALFAEAASDTFPAQRAQPPGCLAHQPNSNPISPQIRPK